MKHVLAIASLLIPGIAFGSFEVVLKQKFEKPLCKYVQSINNFECGAGVRQLSSEYVQNACKEGRDEAMSSLTFQCRVLGGLEVSRTVEAGFKNDLGSDPTVNACRGIVKMRCSVPW